MNLETSYRKNSTGPYRKLQYFISGMRHILGSKSGFRIRIHFLRIRIRIQWIRMEANTDPDTDPDPIRIQGFNDQKLKKK
jgi:hypothetical protein